MVSTSPRLFAAAHVLLRLLAPRHPPCALVLLIDEEHRVCRYGVFKVRAGVRPRETNRPRPVSQNSTAWNAELDVGSRRARASDGAGEPDDIDEPSDLPE